MSDNDFTKALRQHWSHTPSEKVRRYIDKFWGRTQRGQKIIADVEGNHGDYTVSIELDGNGRITSACSCYIGKHGGCHHCTALAHTYLKNPDSFVEIKPVGLDTVDSLDTLQRYLESVTLDESVLQNRRVG